MLRRAAIVAFLLLAMLGRATSVAQIAPVDQGKIDEIFSFASTKSPGCAVATVRDGMIEFARGYGMADVARGIPITTKTPMDLEHWIGDGGTKLWHRQKTQGRLADTGSR